MLKTRVITALVLMALLLPSIFLLSQPAWALLLAAFIGVGAWEWAGLLKWKSPARYVFGLLIAASCAALSFIDPGSMGVMGQYQPAGNWVLACYAVSAFFWCLIVPFWLKRQWALPSGLPGVLAGLVVLLPTWLAMVQLRTLGAWPMLAIFAVVWMADIAAYFSGRAFGKRKLAPTISPGKTWAGAYGAVIGVLLYGLAVRTGSGLTEPGLLVWLAISLFLTAISIIGDLLESLLKRKAGIKDSSNVLPGHGGVLDRIDALTSTLPMVALLLAFLKVS